MVFTLAIAIGGNAAVFSALDAVLFEPLPFPDADRLVYIRQTIRDVATNSVGPLRLEDWNARSTTFDALTGYSTEDVADTSGDFGERRRLARVAPRFFDVWDVEPVAGRGFTGADHEPGAAPLVVISSRYLEYRFGSDPGVLGSGVRIGNESYRRRRGRLHVRRRSDRDDALWRIAGPRSVDGGVRSTTAGTRRQVSWGHSVQWLLVGVQVTLSVMLLTGAGLLARSLYEILRVEPGFDPENVLTFRITGNFGEPVPIAQTVEGRNFGNRLAADDQRSRRVIANSRRARRWVWLRL